MEIDELNAEIEKMEKSIANAKRKIESCEKKRKKLLQEVYNNKYLRLSELQICYVREIYRLDLDRYDVIDFKGVYAGFRYGIFEYENSDEYTNRRENDCEIIIEDEPEIITEEEFCDILKIIHTKLDEKLFSKFAKSK